MPGVEVVQEAQDQAAEPGAGAERSVERDSWILMLTLCLLVCAAGVMNTMLMSVSQRYREIGTIKCLGALDSFVLLSVVAESGIIAISSFSASSGNVVDSPRTTVVRH